MARDLEQLPLFLFNTVLFPHSQIQLHVSDDRYCKMVNDCLADDRPFGVVLIRDERDDGCDPYLVGTAVRIVKVFSHPDGRMDVQVVGERRFRIRKYDESLKYPTGFVEPVIESESVEDEPQEVVDKVRESFRLLVERLLNRHGMDVKVMFPSNPSELSFTIAGLLPLENLEKQRLLEITSTTERLHDLLPLLTSQLVETRELNYRRLSAKDVISHFNPN